MTLQNMSRAGGESRRREGLSVGLLGLGTVGTEVFRLLSDEDLMVRRAGVPIRVARIAVAHPDRVRTVAVPRTLLTTDVVQVVESPDVDIVVEVMGGDEPARGALLRAIALGKPVVTANKRVMANEGPDLLARAHAGGTALHFEGSVGGGIPLIKPIQESLAAGRIHAITAILNGTTNFILTRMARDGWSFDEALSAARQRGFAESDPADDIEGHDAAAKLAILSMVAFDATLTARDVYREGIARITARDFAYARELGFTIKLLAIARDRDDEVEARVHPALIQQDHPLAMVPDEYNAVLVEGRELGPVVFSGRGAGGPPTAVAVVGDVIDIARNIRSGVPERTAVLAPRRVRPIDQTLLPFYLNLQVTDRPGVFARVAGVFGDAQVSIASIVQKSRGEVADVVMVTHDAPGSSVQLVVDRLRGLDAVKAINNVIRVEATI